MNKNVQNAFIEHSKSEDPKEALKFDRRWPSRLNRFALMGEERFNATYSVAADGSHRHTGMKSTARRLRKDAMQARTSHPAKLVKTGGVRS